MAIIASGLSFGLSTGCTPLKIGLGMHPRRFDTDMDLRDRVLRAFVTTVIPGAPADAPNLVRVFEDENYPLARFCGSLVSDLCERGDRLFNNPLFSSLTAEQRTEVIQNALGAQSAMRQLYEGAIFLSQISCYAGIYDDAGGCELIGFRGSAGFVPFADQTYPDPERYLARSLTVNGNYA
jgi:hypothetical protein